MPTAPTTPTVLPVATGPTAPPAVARRRGYGTVAILGGGVAGMSAAHELAERGFRVTVYEASLTTGGKARSIFVPGTGRGGRRDLPGEHGLRFFPSFYRHLPDTMRRIPFGRHPDGVAGNLVATSRTRLARIGARATRLHLRRGRIAAVRVETPRGGRDVLSVVVSDWDAPGAFVPKPAKACSREEIRAEVWAQLKAHVNGRGRETLRDAALVDWYLADSIEHRADGTVVNREPLLINTAGSWRYRPEAVTGIPNLFLAADDVRTNTDIATMEAANEAARRAVNGVLAAGDAAAPLCRIWDLEEPAVFKPLQALDRRRLERGLPHLLATPAA